MNALRAWKEAPFSDKFLLVGLLLIVAFSATLFVGCDRIIEEIAGLEPVEEFIDEIFGDDVEPPPPEEQPGDNPPGGGHGRGGSKDTTGTGKDPTP